MKRFDPYAELGVAKEATEAEIKSAGRAAYKRTHPDVGGDVDSFQRVRRAELVLLDPEARAKFDRTGDVDEERPDNSRAAALQIIERFIGAAIAEYINSGFDPAKDPRPRELLKEFRIATLAEIDGVTGQIGEMKRGIEFLRDMASRFKSDDPASPIQRSIEFKIRDVEASIEANGRAIEMRKLALEITGSYSFERKTESWGATGLGSGFQIYPSAFYSNRGGES